MQIWLAQRWVSPLAVLLMAAAAAPAWGARTAAQIDTDLQGVDGLIQRYPDIRELVKPEYRNWMQQTYVPILRRKLQLLDELLQVDSHDKTAIVYQRDVDLALIATVGDAKATQTLEQDSTAQDAATALSAKLALAMRGWWSDLSADAQRPILSRVIDMAKASPKDDLIARTLVMMADHGASSSDLAREARETVAGQMTGAFASWYRATPNKLGWPLVISENTVQGKSFSTAAWKGKVVLVDFWATWCPPCRASLPHLEQLYQKYHDKGLEVVGVSNDQDRSELVNFLRQNPQMTWPQLFAPSSSSAHWNRLTEQFKINGIPTIYLIDRNGVSRLMQTGGEADDTIQQLLKEKPDPTLVEALPKNEPAPAGAQTAGSSAPPADTSAAKAAPPADDSAVKAARTVNLAKSYIAAHRYDEARSKLQSVVTAYPRTQAARDAEALLNQIAGK